MAKHEKAEVVIEPGQLWPKTPWGSQMQIEIFGVTGEFSTGKTILGLSIAPGNHPAGHPFAGQPRTLYLDMEKSGATYGGTGCQRIDVPAAIAKLYGANYTAKQVAEWFNSLPAKLQPGQFDVIMVDPINDIESGMVDVVKANPAAHGYTANQFNNSVALLMTAVKAHYKRKLMTFGCKTFLFTTHLRDEFKNGKPSGKREPRGKETLAELASLYLWLERLPDDKGAVPDKPSAIVLKQRLADTRMNAAGELEVVNLMPPRIPIATVQSIRQYIANPPDYTKLAAGERVIEKPVTEIELERTRLARAEAERDAAMNRTALLDRQKELEALRQRSAATAPQASDQTARINQAAKERRQIDALAAEAAAKLAAQDAEGQRLAAAATGDHAVELHNAKAARVERFKQLLPASGITPDKLTSALAKHGATRFTELSPALQDGLLAALQKMVGEKN